MLKLARVTRSSARSLRNSSTSRPTIDGDVCLISRLSGTSGNSRSTSASAGMRCPWPANGRPPSGAVNPQPASQLCTSASVEARIARATPQQRAPSGSCETTTWPSLVMWTSLSSASMSTSSARRNAAMVFSGSSPDAPRWA